MTRKQKAILYSVIAGFAWILSPVGWGGLLFVIAIGVWIWAFIEYDKS